MTGIHTTTFHQEMVGMEITVMEEMAAMRPEGMVIIEIGLRAVVHRMKINRIRNNRDDKENIRKIKKAEAENSMRNRGTSNLKYAKTF